MDGMNKYEIKFYSSLQYDSGKACGNDACSGAVEIYSTSTTETSINADQLIYYIKSNPNSPIY